MQLHLTIPQPKPIRGVHNPDQAVGFFKVVAPVRAQRFLPAYIPCGAIER